MGDTLLLNLQELPQVNPGHYFEVIRSLVQLFLWIVYAFANMPSQIGKTELPEPPIGSKSPPYFAVTTIALRDIPANTVLTSGDVGVGRVSIRNGIRHDLTIDSFDDPASVVGFRTKFKLYKNQEISKWDFCSPEFSSRRVVVCCADVSEELC
ncbi:MAG: SAF domain-containing protein [Candidatus Obscuribacter sp.]|nr:SAF domain-containing protein [Candidatus Obscuribacter sp.]